MLVWLAGADRYLCPRRNDTALGRLLADVCDAIEALWFALDKPIREGIFNLGTGRARTFGSLAKAVSAALNLSEAIEFVDMPPALREHYQYFTAAKMERLRAEGFHAVPIALEDSVRHYVSRLERESRFKHPLEEVE